MVSEGLIERAARKVYDSASGGLIYEEAERHPRLLTEAALRYGNKEFGANVNRALGRIYHKSTLRNYLKKEELQDRIRGASDQLEERSRREAVREARGADSHRTGYDDDVRVVIFREIPLGGGEYANTLNAVMEKPHPSGKLFTGINTDAEYFERNTLDNGVRVLEEQ
ncbi:MAG: hypothetical protein IIA87_01595 [Nanoarchaeota archaeon]|nr:hypothetical protein [Nanoarchaeota archaeon]